MALAVAQASLLACYTEHNIQHKARSRWAVQFGRRVEDQARFRIEHRIALDFHDS